MKDKINIEEGIKRLLPKDYKFINYFMKVVRIRIEKNEEYISFDSQDECKELEKIFLGKTFYEKNDPPLKCIIVQENVVVINPNFNASKEIEIIFEINKERKS